jgi:hypothetical protein
MMEENKNENGLTIDLIEDTEEVIPNTVTLTAGETSPAKVIINGHNRVLSIQSLGTLLTVGRGVTLTLRNITLQGCAGNNAPLVTVQGGKLILGAGVTLMGNKSTGDAGGVWVNNGELALNEGVVIKEMEAQRGGGVLIDGYGKLSMNGGTIGGALPDGNAAAGENGGGGVLVLDGSFDMFGGTIQSNSASAQDSGGGVLVLNGSFIMYEGIIKSNRTLSPGIGGGVGILADGTLNLYNGTIKENSASAPGSGGGVGIAGGTLNLYNGTIKENSASAQSSAGGVGVFPDGTFNFYNGAIKGNRAEYNVPGPDVESGGAVFVLWDHYYGKYGNFIMYGGTIGGENSGDANTAAIGANAVWINGGGFDMAGGTITGNAGFNNYGVYIDRSFVIKGSARIDINDKVFLSNEYAEIYIEGALSASPAANIIHGAPVSGTTRLLAGSSNLLTENYRKFLYDGFDNRIIVEYDESLNRWYGIYHE